MNENNFSEDKLVYAEERANLARVEDTIADLYKTEWGKYLKYKKEIDEFVVYTWEDRDRLLDLREIVEPYKQTAEEYLTYKPSPYFMRVDVGADGRETKTLFIGKKGLADGSHIIIWDWRSPIAQGARFTKEQEFKVGDADYVLYLRRAIEIENQEIKYINTQFDAASGVLKGKVIDPFLLSVLRDKRRDYKLTDIIKTIQLNQSEIIGKPIDENFVVQGCAGSGKTMILLHRLSHLLFNYKNYGTEKYCILTPNEFFNVHIDDLSRELEIDSIPRFTVEQYYVELIKRLTADDKEGKESKVKFPTAKLITEKDWDEGFLSEVYSNEYREELTAFYNGIWERFQKTLEEKRFSSVVRLAEKEIPTVSKYNFETFQRLRSYYAAVVATAKETERNLQTAQEKANKSLQLLADYRQRLQEASDALPLLEDVIHREIDRALATSEGEYEKLNLDAADIAEEIRALEAKKEKLSAEIGDSFTPEERTMSDRELVLWTYVAKGDTSFAKHMRSFCKEDIEELQQLQATAQKIPFYNFGKKSAIGKKIEERSRQYQEKALEVMREYKALLQSNFLAKQADLQKIEDELAEKNRQRREIQTKQRRESLTISRIQNAKTVLQEEKQIAILENLIAISELSFLKETLQKLVSALKTVKASQNAIVLQSEELKKNESIIKTCQERNLDENFKLELLEFSDSLKMIDMKNIYPLFEERLKATYDKYGQKYKSNENYRHKLYVLLLMCGLYYGTPKKTEKFISVDEAQDISASELSVLKNVLGSESVFNLYGDVNQLVYSYKGITDWEEVDDIVPFNLYFLNENYRNTIQITEYCNNEFDAEVVAIGLKGDDVKTCSLEKAVAYMKEQRKLDPQSRAAILYKKGKEPLARKAAEMLRKEDYALDAVDNGKVSIITVEMAKGLEFENVVVITDDMTINEKYISYTRALQNLIVV